MSGATTLAISSVSTIPPFHLALVEMCVVFLSIHLFMQFNLSVTLTLI